MKRWTEEVCNGHLDLVRNDDGEYCLYEDYKALESKLGTCNKACADGLAMMAKQDAAMVELRSRLNSVLVAARHVLNDAWQAPPSVTQQIPGLEELSLVVVSIDLPPDQTTVVEKVVPIDPVGDLGSNGHGPVRKHE